VPVGKEEGRFLLISALSPFLPIYLVLLCPKEKLWFVEGRVGLTPLWLNLESDHGDVPTELHCGGKSKRRSIGNLFE
jgi:hypothetical protein